MNSSCACTNTMSNVLETNDIPTAAALRSTSSSRSCCTCHDYRPSFSHPHSQLESGGHGHPQRRAARHPWHSSNTLVRWYKNAGRDPRWPEHRYTTEHRCSTTCTIWWYRKNHLTLRIWSWPPYFVQKNFKIIVNSIAEFVNTPLGRYVKNKFFFFWGGGEQVYVALCNLSNRFMTNCK